MGGKGSGGARVGAGRKRNTEFQHWLSGDASKIGRGKGPAERALAEIERFGPPRGLSKAARRIWEGLAPHAFDARTLSAGTAAAFRDLCEAIVVRDGLMRRIRRDGFCVGGEKHPLLTDHRGWYQRVESGMLKFRLAPIGKPVVEAPEQPADPFAKFEDTGEAVN